MMQMLRADVCPPARRRGHHDAKTARRNLASQTPACLIVGSATRRSAYGKPDGKAPMDARDIERALDEAERNGMPLTATDRTTRSQLARLAQANVLARPMRGMYARADYWSGLSPEQRDLAIMRALATSRPMIVFARTSAALAYGLPVSRQHLGTIHVATSRRAHSETNRPVARHVVTGDVPERFGGMRLTSRCRTLFDCVRTLEFGQALAIADSGIRRLGVTRGRMRAYIDGLGTNQSGSGGARFPGIRHARFVIGHSDGRAESGGESIARSVMIAEGFQVPTLQETLADPLDRSRTYRVDFSWHLADGRHVVGELDGRAKYRNESMTGGRDIVDVLADERLRESRLSATGAIVMRFSFADVMNRPFFISLLERYGIPRSRPPEIPPAAKERRRTVN